MNWLVFHLDSVVEISPDKITVLLFDIYGIVLGSFEVYSVYLTAERIEQARIGYIFLAALIFIVNIPVCVGLRKLISSIPSK